MDWSTATMAEGKLAVARARGETVPDGVLVDADGEPSNEPADFYDGGALLPFGAHKGSGLSVMIQLVAGALGGTGVFGEQGTAANGLVLIALDPAPSPRISTRPRARSAPRWPPRSRRTVSTRFSSQEKSSAARASSACATGSDIPSATWSELSG